MDYRSIVSDSNNLYEALLKSVKGSQWKESSQKAALTFLDLIFDLSKDLRNQTYKSGKEYKFTLHERGRVRAITSLNIRDRIVRHVLCDKIFLPLIRNKLIYDNGASLEGRGLSFSKARFETHIHKYYNKYHTNKGFILFGDFSKFYDNISHYKAKELLLELVDNDSYITWLLDLIFDRFVIDASEMTDEEYINAKDGIFNRLEYSQPENSIRERTIEKSINIGDQLAQVIGVYYPHELDNFVKIICREKFYGRYMDDWYIIHPSVEHLQKMLLRITDKVAELGLHINTKKTTIYPLDEPFSFLQVRYNLTKTGSLIKRINPKRVSSMRIHLKKLAIKYYNGDMDYTNIENTFKSWVGGFHKYLSKSQLSNLISLYEYLFDCKVRVIHNKLYIERHKS